MKIEILCRGGRPSVELERRVNAALEQTGVSAEILHIYDPMEIARRHAAYSPAVVINGDVKISGKVPSVEELKRVIRSLLVST
jgi:enamine deaminase RidA (YjgF/YER057c/UK114 family)